MTSHLHVYLFVYVFLYAHGFLRETFLFNISLVNMFFMFSLWAGHDRRVYGVTSCAGLFSSRQA